MNNKSFILAVIILLSAAVIAESTETTWRHSGFEVSQYDINFTSIYNITELRVLEWGWNLTTPSISDSNRAKMYYDNNQKKIMQSINGGAYEETITNSTTNTINNTKVNKSDAGELYGGTVQVMVNLSNNTGTNFIIAANTTNISATRTAAGNWSIDLNNPYFSSSSGSGTSAAQNNMSQINSTRGATYLDGTNYTVLADAGSLSYNITLPVASQNSGRTYLIKRVDNSTRTVLINTSEKIDYLDVYNLTWQGQIVKLQANGSQWWILEETAPVYLTFSSPQNFQKQMTTFGKEYIIGYNVSGRIHGTYNFSWVMGTTAGITSWVEIRVNGVPITGNITNGEFVCCVYRSTIASISVPGSGSPNRIEFWGDGISGQTTTFREFNITTVMPS